jgi:hypothetical protein
MKESHLKSTLPPLAIKAERAMKEAMAAAVAEHWRAGRPVHIWQDEQVVALYEDGTTVPVKQK